MFNTVANSISERPAAHPAAITPWHTKFWTSRIVQGAGDPYTSEILALARLDGENVLVAKSADGSVRFRVLPSEPLHGTTPYMMMKAGVVEFRDEAGTVVDPTSLVPTHEFNVYPDGTVTGIVPEDWQEVIESKNPIAIEIMYREAFTIANTPVIEQKKAQEWNDAARIEEIRTQIAG